MTSGHSSYPLVEFELTRILEEAPGLDAAAPRILQTLCEGLGWQVGELWLLDADANLLRRTAAWHSPDVDVSAMEAITRGVAATPASGLPGRMFRTGNIEYIPNVSSDPAFTRKEAAARAGLCCALIFPLTDGRATTGGIILLRREPLEPDGRLRTVLTTAGRRIGEFAREHQAIGRSGAYFRNVVENLPDVVALIGLDGTIHYENVAIVQVLGYDRREQIGRNLYDFVHAEDVPSVLASIRAALEQPGITWSNRLRLRHKDGSWKVLEAACCADQREGGRRAQEGPAGGLSAGRGDRPGDYGARGPGAGTCRSGVDE
ncbi:MAG: PAS domain S-box protein [Chloroflexi bacterium]|nr:MAG: PAS domain S-box protein [Chloroflexota bacterium]